MAPDKSKTGRIPIPLAQQEIAQSISEFPLTLDGKVDMCVSEVRTIAQCVTRLTLAIVGDEELGQEGMVKRQKDNETRLKRLEVIVATCTGVLIVIAFFKEWILHKFL